MTLQIVELAAVEARPWRNGGGVAHDLLAWPGITDWTLRISVARIDRDGPFSAYPGVRRWFAVIDGAGVELQFADGARIVRADDMPLHFDGAAAPGCRLLDGPTLDLNLMLRDGCGVGALHRLAPGHGVPRPHRFKALFVADAAVLRIDGGAPLTLAAGTLAWSDQAAGELWDVEGDAGLRAWAVDHQPEPLP